MMTALNCRWPHFGLRTMFAVVTLAAMLSPLIAPVFNWFFPPRLTDQELIDLIVRTVTPITGELSPMTQEEWSELFPLQDSDP
jgi:hypothetical protein